MHVAGGSFPHDQQAVFAGAAESDGEHCAVLREGRRGRGVGDERREGGLLKHTLAARRETLHGHWSNALAPALTIDSGDTVSFECLDALWTVGRPDGAWPWSRVEPRDSLLDQGHALTGPVAVRGARAGT